MPAVDPANIGPAKTAANQAAPAKPAEARQVPLMGLYPHFALPFGGELAGEVGVCELGSGGGCTFTWRVVMAGPGRVGHHPVCRYGRGTGPWPRTRTCWASSVLLKVQAPWESRAVISRSEMVACPEPLIRAYLPVPWLIL